MDILSLVDQIFQGSTHLNISLWLSRSVVGKEDI